MKDSLRILVTGGTGSLAGAVISRFAHGGHQVGTLSRRALDAEGTQPFTLPQDSWTKAGFTAVLAQFHPDVIFHLVGSRHADTVEGIYEVNTFLGVRLMESAAEILPGTRIVLAGSASEYGRPIHPDGTVEESDCCRPIGAYAIAKLAQSLHGLARAALGQPLTVARIFNLVDPTQQLGTLFPDIASRLATGRPELEVGNIDTARDFVTCREAARVLAELATNERAAGRVVNVCSGVATPVAAGIDRLISRQGRRVRLVRKAASAASGDIDVIKGSTSVLSELGIEPCSINIWDDLDLLMDRWTQRKLL